MNDAISNYRKAKEGMQAIIDRHMTEAFAQIKREYGVTPVSVDTHVVDWRVEGSRYLDGKYAGCTVRLDGE